MKMLWQEADKQDLITSAMLLGLILLAAGIFTTLGLAIIRFVFDGILGQH